MRILIPVDGSKPATAAVHFVAARAHLMDIDSTIELLNVQARIPARAARIVGRALCDTYYTEEANKVLIPATRTLKKAGFNVAPHYAVGSAIDIIAQTLTQTVKGARQRAPIDLLIMGTHGHGAWMGLLMGSVSMGVLARTQTPVLLVRGPTAKKHPAMRVGIAVDGSAYGLAAARYVISHRTLLGEAATIQVIHVVPDFLGAAMPDMAGLALPAYTPDEIKTMQDNAFENALKPVRALFKKAAVPIEEVRLTASAGHAISAYARKKKLDLLVMGSHGHGALNQALLGSVATRVAARCDTPLLLIRSKRA